MAIFQMANQYSLKFTNKNERNYFNSKLIVLKLLSQNYFDNN